MGPIRLAPTSLEKSLLQSKITQLLYPIPSDLKPFHIPNLTTFDWLFKRIPKALFISSYPQQILVELEETGPVEFQNSLQVLPPRIGSLNFGYINGPLFHHKYARAKCPDPTVLDGSFDDTNYLLPESGGALRPGVLLECIGNVGELMVWLRAIC